MMFTTDNIKKDLAKPLNSPPPTSSPVAYQSLSVVKKIAAAKFPVYLASSKVNKQNYAMKIFNHSGEDPHPCFQNEIRFSTLKHPNVIAMVHYEEERDTLYKGKLRKVSYILMEYAPYGDFYDFMCKYGSKLDEKLIRTFFRQLIDGIEYLHSREIAHLDLKPENLLLGTGFNLKIADFDMSTVKGDDKIIGRGTKNYRAPEFFKAESSDSKVRASYPADIYSAAIILFVMKSGGMYPHCENQCLKGVNLEEMMYQNNEQFWKKHCKIQGRDTGFFGKEFKELFNAMVKREPNERLKIKEIKESSWYNGPVYTPVEFEGKMKEILKL